MRVFFSDQVSFTFSVTPNVQVDPTVLAYVFLNGSATPHTVLALAPGQIVEEEFSAGEYRYNIGDYEVPNTTTAVEVRWLAHVSGSEVDTFPLITNPTPVQQLEGDFLEVVSSDPTVGSDGVDVRGRILLTFDEAIGSFVAGQMFLRRSGSVDISRVSAHINPGNPLQLVIDARTKLDDNTPYELLVPVGSVLSVSGAGLASDFKLNFKTTEDDFQTLHQATSDGVVERAGPLKIVVPSLPTSSSPGVESSTPAHQSCNQSTDRLVFVFDEDVDPYDSIPQLEFLFEPVFKVSRYHIGQKFWGKDDVEPEHPTDVIMGGGVQARGQIVFHTNPLDGETVELSDGVDSVVFEFDDNASVVGGNVAVLIGADALETLNNFITEIEAQWPTLELTPVNNTLDGDATLLLINMLFSSTGNVPIVHTLSDATVDGMFGGVDISESEPWTTVEIIDNKVIIQLNKKPTGNAFFTIKLSGLVTAADHSVAFQDTEIKYITGLWPMRGTVSEIRRSIRNYISEDLTDCDLAVLLTEVSIHYFRIYKNEALPHQHCAVQAETILLLLEDYMAAAGLDGMKSLGPFQVSKRSGWFMNGPYRRWQEELDECKETLLAFFNRPVVGIKSANSELERPTGMWRIRTWKNTKSMRPDEDENQHINRSTKIPPKNTLWS